MAQIGLQQQPTSSHITSSSSIPINSLFPQVMGMLFPLLLLPLPLLLSILTLSLPMLFHNLHLYIQTTTTNLILLLI